MIGTFHPQTDTLSYEPFFGLKEKPFGLHSDPRFLYHSPTHAATFENLLGAIRRREGLLVLTGEIGTGKTTLCHAVLRSLGRKTFSSFVPDPFASREDLLKTLLIDFGVMAIEDLTTGPLKQASRTELGYLLAGFLDSLTPLDAFVVVIIDEAHNMTLPLIEETRILADTHGGKGHLQMVFVGQPELHAKLKSPEMRQVDQRVCSYNRLDALSHDAVAGYIQHRLRVAGGSRERVLFAPDIMDTLHRRSGGVPRLLNRICDRALHLAHLRQAHCVDREILETALFDIGPTTLTPTWAAIVSSGMEVTQPQDAASAPPPASVETPAAEAARSPKVTSQIVDLIPAVDDDESFSRSVDEWLKAHDLGPPVRKRSDTALDHFAEEPVRPTSGPRQAAEQNAATRRKAPATSSWRDVDGELRSETYMKRLGRVWAKRLAIAAVCIVALNIVVVGAFQLSDRLGGLMGDSTTLPPLAARPTARVLTIVPPAAPRIEAPQARIEGSQAVASGDYFVAVGMFASLERADRLVRELTQAGLPACQQPFELRSQRVQRVVLGSFATQEDAAVNLERLRRLGGFDDAHVAALSSNHPRGSCVAAGAHVTPPPTPVHVAAYAQSPF